MKQFCLICMCLFVPFLIKAQNATLPLDQLVDLEYRIFGSEDFEERSSLLLEKSRLYKAFQEYQLALNTLDRILNSGSSPLSYQVVSEKISLNYLLGNHQQVKNIVLEAKLTLDTALDEDIKLVEILNYVALEEFEEAQKAYQLLFPENQELNEVFDHKKLVNPEKAFNLSLILPGSGQMYAGYFAKGVMSAMIQAAFMTVGIRGITRGYYFTEALTSIALFQGFYFGGAEHAIELSNRRNEKIKNDLSIAILESIPDK